MSLSLDLGVRRSCLALIAAVPAFQKNRNFLCGNANTTQILKFLSSPCLPAVSGLFNR